MKRAHVGAGNSLFYDKSNGNLIKGDGSYNYVSPVVPSSDSPPGAIVEASFDSYMRASWVGISLLICFRALLSTVSDPRAPARITSHSWGRTISPDCVEKTRNMPDIPASPCLVSWAPRHHSSANLFLREPLVQDSCHPVPDGTGIVL